MYFAAIRSDDVPAIRCIRSGEICENVQGGREIALILCCAETDTHGIGHALATDGECVGRCDHNTESRRLSNEIIDAAWHRKGQPNVIASGLRKKRQARENTLGKRNALPALTLMPFELPLRYSVLDPDRCDLRHEGWRGNDRGIN